MMGGASKPSSNSLTVQERSNQEVQLSSRDDIIAQLRCETIKIPEPEKLLSPWPFAQNELKRETQMGLDDWLDR